MSPHVANTSFANLPYSVNLPHLPCLLSTPFSNLPHLPCLSSTSFSLPPCDRVLAGKLSVFLLRKCFCSLAFLTNHLFPLYQFLFECSTPELLFLPCFSREESFLSIQNVIVIAQNLLVLCPCKGWFTLHSMILVPLRAPAPTTAKHHPSITIIFFTMCVLHQYCIVCVPSLSTLTWWHVTSLFFYYFTCASFYLLPHFIICLIF